MLAHDLAATGNLSVMRDSTNHKVTNLLFVLWTPGLLPWTPQGSVSRESSCLARGRVQDPRDGLNNDQCGRHMGTASCTATPVPQAGRLTSEQ